MQNLCSSVHHLLPNSLELYWQSHLTFCVFFLLTSLLAVTLIVISWHICTIRTKFYILVARTYIFLASLLLTLTFPLLSLKVMLSYKQCSYASNANESRMSTCNCSADLQYCYKYTNSLYWQCLECTGYVSCETRVQNVCCIVDNTGWFSGVIIPSYI